MSARVRSWDFLRTTPVGRRAVLLSGIALPLGLRAARTASASTLRAATPPRSPRLTLPAPTGRHRLGTVSLYLVDRSRPDPWVPAIPFRELVIQIWYPAHAADGYVPAPYFTPVTARAFEQLSGFPVLRWPMTEARSGAPVRLREGGWPVVLYSPGLGGQRTETTCLVEDLASNGYVVVTIDHIHDSSVVELPDGRVEADAVPPFTTADQTELSAREIGSRAADVGFVLDQLAAINRGVNPDQARRPLPRGLPGAFDLGRIGMFGHSDGGSTTAHVLHTDARVKAGANLDGTLYTPQAIAGSDRPLLLFGRQDLDSFEADTWAEFRRRQRGPRLRLNLLGSEHETFTDVAALASQIAPVIGEPPSVVAETIGTIDGDRAVAVERAYVNAWFDTYLRHRDSPLLAGPSPRYPEIRYTR